MWKICHSVVWMHVIKLQLWRVTLNTSTFLCSQENLLHSFCGFGLEFLCHSQQISKWWIYTLKLLMYNTVIGDDSELAAFSQATQENSELFLFLFFKREGTVIFHYVWQNISISTHYLITVKLLCKTMQFSLVSSSDLSYSDCYSFFLKICRGQWGVRMQVASWACFIHTLGLVTKLAGLL